MTQGLLQSIVCELIYSKLVGVKQRVTNPYLTTATICIDRRRYVHTGFFLSFIYNSTICWDNTFSVSYVSTILLEIVAVMDFGLNVFIYFDLEYTIRFIFRWIWRT